MNFSNFKKIELCINLMYKKHSKHKNIKLGGDMKTLEFALVSSTIFTLIIMVYLFGQLAYR